MIRTCRACTEVLTGPAVQCASCAASVHSHCIARRLGANVCLVCAHEMDFMQTQRSIQTRLAQSSVGFGRVMAAGGQVTGQAIGAVSSGVLGGAARLVTGCASGAAAAVQGFRTVELPSFGAAPTPARPRALEEYDISEAGTDSARASAQDLSLAVEIRALRKEMMELKAENVRLCDASSAASAQGGGAGYATPLPEKLEESCAAADSEEQKIVKE